MSRIIISEQEADKVKSFDATENSVLIPILWADSYTFVKDAVDDSKYKVEADGTDYKYKIKLAGEIPNVVVYTDYTKFNQEVGSHVINVGTEVDKSFLMAQQLLLQGLTVVIKPIAFTINFPIDASKVDTTNLTTTEVPTNIISVEDEANYNSTLNSSLETALNQFKDKNLFNIKFITTGAHANVGIITNGVGKDSHVILQTLADGRGDCVALIEPQRSVGDLTTDVAVAVKLDEITVSTKKAIIGFPWGVHAGLETGKLTEMPCSFSYLMAYANSVKNNANWFPAAGVTRGEIPTLKYPVYEVGESLMHVLQREEQFTYTPAGGQAVTKLLSVCVNPIMNAGTYGYRIWGDFVALPTADTLEKKFVDFLSVRIMLCDIEKQIYHGAMRTLFEPNDDIAWFNFKFYSQPLLDKMKSGRGLEWYLWHKEKDKDKGELNATLELRPYGSVTSIFVNIVPTDSGVEVGDTL